MRLKVFRNKVTSAVVDFILWHEKFGNVSYDRMDFWASRGGIRTKKLFYRNKYLGAPFATYGMILENFLPRIQKLYAKPHREVIGDAHLVMGYLNYYEFTGSEHYLSKAESILNEMLVYANTTGNKLSWGYSFGWQTENGFWERSIPLITITPYAFWAFKRHFEITKCPTSLASAISIADFVLQDLRHQVMRNGTICYSYSPVKDDIVINANSYRAAVLCDAYSLTGNKAYLESAQDNIAFILEYQGENGEWYYEAKSPRNNFIDNFHTCFILRNLYYCYKVTRDENTLLAIRKGYDYYLKNLFYDSGKPKHFAKAKYFKFRKYEMYDYAEGIKLGVLLKDDFPSAFSKAIWLAKDLIDNYQTDKGHFITRVTTLGTSHKVPYLRWPQAQLFASLTNLLNTIE